MALIRCSNCGNLASSKTANCPTCGAPIGTSAQETQTTVAESISEAQPRTLNDIMRERSAQTTLADSFIEEKRETTPPTPPAAPQHVEPQQEYTPKNEDNAYDGYSDNMIDDYEAESARQKRTANGFKLAAIAFLIMLIPAAYFSLSLGMKQKTIKANLEIVESARRIFEDENAMLQRNAEDLVTELESLKDQNDTMMV